MENTNKIQFMELKLNTYKIERPDKNFFVYSTQSKKGEKVVVKFTKNCNIQPECSGILKVAILHTSLTTEENYKGKEELVLWVRQVEDFTPYKKNFKTEDYFEVNEELPY